MQHVVYWILGGLSVLVIVGVVIAVLGHFSGTATDSEQPPDDYDITPGRGSDSF